MSRVVTMESSTATNRLARVITEVCAPSVIVVVLPLVVAWSATHSLSGTLVWGVLVAVTSSLLPMSVIVWGARRGRWDTHHVRDRAGRMIPFVVLLGLSGVGLAVLVVAHAPREMIALDLAMISSLVVAMVITLWWKISMHAAVAAGATVIMCVVWGLAWLSLSVLVAAVGWSRVRVKDHTVAQVVAGVVLGVLVGGGVYLWGIGVQLLH